MKNDHSGARAALSTAALALGALAVLASALISALLPGRVAVELRKDRVTREFKIVAQYRF